MPEDYKTCPACQTMLLDNMVQCPTCKHIVDQVRYQQWQAEAQTSLASVDEAKCQNCGEMVRVGLVRCWNCNSFMRDDIKQAYRDMQSTPQPVIYSLPEEEVTADDGQSAASDDDGFALGQVYGVQTPPEVETPPPRGETKQPPASPDTPPSSPGEAAATDSADEASHSIATGGDALLEVALEEQKEEKHRKRQRIRQRLVDAVIVFCPNGHRIEVDERHRGRTGRCPKCKSPFYVPVAEKPKPGEDGETVEVEDKSFGKYTRTMLDLPVHSVNPERLKLKPGSLQADFQQFDFFFANDELLLASLTNRKGAAGAKTKKRQEDRDKLYEYLRTGGPLSDAPVEEKFTLTAEQCTNISVAQPALYPHESLFADVLVFGEGMVAVRLPIADDPKIRRFASFSLLQFREFTKTLSEVFGIGWLGQDENVPLTDNLQEAKCHYSEEPVKFLESVEYYQADSEIELSLVGRKCQACGLIVSEDSRKKEKIGGVNGKAIAKAKCPKCQNKFGNISLFDLNEPEPKEATAEEGTPAETETAESS